MLGAGTKAKTARPPNGSPTSTWSNSTQDSEWPADTAPASWTAGTWSKPGDYTAAWRTAAVQGRYRGCVGGIWVTRLLLHPCQHQSTAELMYMPFGFRNHLRQHTNPQRAARPRHQTRCVTTTTHPAPSSRMVICGRHPLTRCFYFPLGVSTASWWPERHSAFAIGTCSPGLVTYTQAKVWRGLGNCRLNIVHGCSKAGYKR